MKLYDTLLAAVSARSNDGAIRIRAVYEPTGGPGARIFPPTVKTKATDAAGYLTEPRYVDGEAVTVVLLDQRQSQANRCEQALLDAVRRQDLFIPHLELTTEAEGMPVRITSLEAPHRSRDAYFRDAQDPDGMAFDKTEPGTALRQASSADLRVYLRLVPSDLVYGVWDSLGHGRFPRGRGGHLSTPVIPWGVPTGLDSRDPRWRRYTEKVAMQATVRGSDCQFCRLRPGRHPSPPPSPSCRSPPSLSAAPDGRPGSWPSTPPRPPDLQILNAPPARSTAPTSP